MGARWLLCAVTAAVLLTAVVAGCGSSGSSSTGGGSESTTGEAPAAESTSPAESTGGSSLVAEAQSALEKNYEGTDGPLPTSAPKPAKDQTVWIIACSTAAEGCSQPAEGVAEAAKVLGWKAHVADGKLNPAVYNSLVNQAVAAGANAIVLVAVDCSLTKASLENAKKAGVQIVGLYALDCDEGSGDKGQKLFNAEIIYTNGMNYNEWLLGPDTESQADFVIAKTEGKANVILMRENDTASVRLADDGFERAMEKCTECKLTTVEFTGEDLLNGNLQSKVQTALAQNPEADVVYAPYDASITLGIQAGVQASGRSGDILLIGDEGLAPNIQLIKEGKQSFAAGAPARWSGWAAVDELIRSLDGEPAVKEGIGLQSIDPEHNIPTTTPYYDGNTVNGKPKVDYKAAYEEIWGLG